MGKKRRMIAHPKKFGAKYAAHPACSDIAPVKIEEKETIIEASPPSAPVAEIEEITANSIDKKITKKKKSVWSKKKEN